MRKVFADHEIVVEKLRACQAELRGTMLSSLICLDFYRDMDQTLNEIRYSWGRGEGGGTAQEVVGVIDRLMQEHGLATLDFDTERVANLVESVEQHVRGEESVRKAQVSIEEEFDVQKYTNREIIPNMITTESGIQVRITKVN
jgi:hypothetical protein